MVGVVAALAMAAACGGGGSAGTGAVDPGDRETAARTATVVTPAVLKPGAAIPLPAESVLVLRGSISGTNEGDMLRLGVETLDQLGLHQVQVFEPWLKEDVGFQGVWLADLLDVAGVAGSASGIHFVALDDYSVDLSMEEVDAGGILLATRTADGEPLPIDQGGPTRIVFLDGVAAGVNADLWIWSLKEISVR